MESFTWLHTDLVWAGNGPLHTISISSLLQFRFSESTNVTSQGTSPTHERILAYFVNSTIDSGSEKSNPGIPSGGIFFPRVYSKKSSVPSSFICFLWSVKKIKWSHTSQWHQSTCSHAALHVLVWSNFSKHMFISCICYADSKAATKRQAIAHTYPWTTWRRQTAPPGSSRARSVSSTCAGSCWQ